MARKSNDVLQVQEELNRVPPGRVICPVRFAALMWPDVTFYRKQRAILYSVVDNEETVVPAGNMLGKDFVAAYIALWFFLTRQPCRIVTTSADYSQLEAVLWGEIRRFIQSSAYPLEYTRGGPLVVNHMHLRRMLPAEPNARTGRGNRPVRRMCGLSYAVGRVAAKGEGMLGHHIADVGDGIPRTFWMADEASGVDDVSYERADTWANRKLMIGNCYPCNNIFFRAVEGGDVELKLGEGAAL